MARIIYLIFLIIVLIGCKKQNTKIDSQTDYDSNVESDFTRALDSIKIDVKKEKVVKAQEIKVDGRIYAYEDGIKIFSSPNDSSPVIGTLNYADSLVRFKWYKRHNGKLDTDGAMAKWFAVLYKSDTAWILSKANVSTINSIDTIGNLLIKNHYRYCEYGGYGCYENTIVYNWKKGTIMFNQYFNVVSTFQANDTLMVLSTDGKLLLYNLKTDSFIYESKAMITSKSNLADRIYFVRNNPDSAKHFRFIVEFIQYLIPEEKEQQLFIEPDDSTFPCIIDDGTVCHPMQIRLTDKNELITVKLFRLSKYGMDEFDANTLTIELDNYGNILRRSVK